MSQVVGAGEVSAEELSNCVMPAPHVGQTVLWYPHGVVDPRHERAAIVLAIRNGSISLWQVNAYARDGVKHVTDPRLRMNQEQRADGAWDFTPLDRQLEQLVAMVNSLAAAQGAPDLLSRDAPNRGVAMTQLWSLRRQCQTLGHTAWQGLSRNEAEEYIARHART